MKTKDTISWIGFLLISIFVLFPLFWGIRTSLSPRYETSFIHLYSFRYFDRYY